MPQVDAYRLAHAIGDHVERHRRAFADRWPVNGLEVVGIVADVIEDANPGNFDRAEFLRICAPEVANNSLQAPATH